MAGYSSSQVPNSQKVPHIGQVTCGNPQFRGEQGEGVPDPSPVARQHPETGAVVVGDLNYAIWKILGDGSCRRRREPSAERYPPASPNLGILRRASSAEPLSSQDCFMSTASVPRLSPWQLPHRGSSFHTARQPIRITTEIGRKLVPQWVVFHTTSLLPATMATRPSLLAQMRFNPKTGLADRNAGGAYPRMRSRFGSNSGSGWILAGRRSPRISMAKPLSASASSAGR